MINKRIPIIAVLAFTTTFMVGCKKNEAVKKEDTVTQTQTTEKEKIVIQHVEKVTFKDLTELKNFSKKNTSDFGKFLSSNNIDNTISTDGSIAINKNMTYEKYTKEFNQLAYTHIENNFKNGTGYLKTGIKFNFHLEETLNTQNNFAKAIFTIVNTHNPAITEEDFNNQLISATSDKTNISDYQFDLGINGMSLNIYTKPDINEREFVLSVRQELEFPSPEEMIKEYKTVKEFKEYSDKLSINITDKIAALNEKLKNAYVGKCDSIEVELNSTEINVSSSFAQKFGIKYNAKNIDSIPNELIDGLYETIETVITKEKLSKIISKDDLKAYLKSLEIYSGLHTTGSPIDETGEIISPNSLPIFDGIIDLSIGFENVIKNNKNESEETSNDKNKNNINKYNTYIEMVINIPVKAEGITSL